MLAFANVAPLLCVEDCCSDYVVVLEECPFCHNSTCDGSCQDGDPQPDIVIEE